jgi:endonuclease-3 related protein
MDTSSALSLDQAYELMLKHHGHQGWWPAESDFEMCVGAILTQNTSWTQVVKALDQLRCNQCLAPNAMHAADEATLAQWIRPAGYFRLKARRLKAFVGVLIESFSGDLVAMLEGETNVVRERLLAIHGIGPETADSMLLYAGNHPVFVVDAYTRRIFSRHGWCSEDESYQSLQDLCHEKLGCSCCDEKVSRVEFWKDYHAQLVRIGKEFCRPRQPRCQACPLGALIG